MERSAPHSAATEHDVNIGLPVGQAAAQTQPCTTGTNWLPPAGDCEPATTRPSGDSTSVLSAIFQSSLILSLIHI